MASLSTLESREAGVNAPPPVATRKQEAPIQTVHEIMTVETANALKAAAGSLGLACSVIDADPAQKAVIFLHLGDALASISKASVMSVLAGGDADTFAGIIGSLKIIKNRGVTLV